ncbi:MAG: threonylcarbamoyl-AMP synthase [Proteobacteria bacterium]|nr:threonylcarbamoyl-AMP synthase [Pseudomonadota bacterium]MBU1389027.1 threonylcarbamoyl-AMP synthase [Pseudomonadota bacterium]MBU1543579.1 threonylcarbamoyl-AMP synthase [Pseudomonadota bacterium]MBU2429680.1 threonylcarbamoyl-AMP synthase [Pseudomonadota bacterium]MBU2481439.1 threonylcarbamoyl-AMP synthase [Pseudomonadota bacterium]
MIKNNIVPVDPDTPDQQTILQAAKIIGQNGVVIFPAKCLYGVAAKALDENAVQKVFDLKQRPKNNPILVLIPDRKQLKDLVVSIPETAQKLMDAFWPGNLTLIFEAGKHIPQILTAGTGKIGIRVPVHPVAKALVDSLGYPVTGTSANLSGQESCSRILSLDPFITAHADLILDAGTLKGGKGSSIVDITQFPPVVLREGEVSSVQIKSCI